MIYEEISGVSMRNNTYYTELDSQRLFDKIADYAPLGAQAG